MLILISQQKLPHHPTFKGELELKMGALNTSGAKGSVRQYVG